MLLNHGISRLTGSLYIGRTGTSSLFTNIASATTGPAKANNARKILIVDGQIFKIHATITGIEQYNQCVFWLFLGVKLFPFNNCSSNSLTDRNNENSTNRWTSKITPQRTTHSWFLLSKFNKRHRASFFLASESLNEPRFTGGRNNSYNIKKQSRLSNSWSTSFGFWNPLYVNSNEFQILNSVEKA